MTTTEGRQITVEELRGLFLFESLDDDKLAWLAENGRIEFAAAGSTVLAEGDPADDFVVLLEGTIALTRRVQRDEIEVTRTEQRGAYSGAVQAYLGDQIEQTYNHSTRAVTDSRFFMLPAEIFAKAMRKWFPMAMHLLEGLFLGLRASDNLVGQRQRLIALGSLSAGLTHELNNPAAAAARATSMLRERLTRGRQELSLIAASEPDPRQFAGLIAAQEQAVCGIGSAPRRSAVAASELEDELADWLQERGVEGAWEIAPVFVAAGLDLSWAEDIDTKVTATSRQPVYRWLADTLESELLISEIEDASGRISLLVGAAKQYSQMDRAPHQWLDVHDGLDSTLVMLNQKLGARVRVVKDYDRTLPTIPGYPGELNQVWTNLIDNAVAAMDRSGTMTIRTARDGDQVLVEVADTGSGISEANQHRVFEPFFSTKPVGEGTGLGLDISYRIVVNRHGGDLRVQSVPGDTRFQVRLPVREPSSAQTGAL